MLFEKVWRLATLDVGIDLGTANTVVHVKGKGVVIRQPSVVARHIKTKEILAIGEEAKKMLGKNPANIEVVRPLHDGVIADFDAAEAMLTQDHVLVAFAHVSNVLGSVLDAKRAATLAHQRRL